VLLLNGLELYAFVELVTSIEYLL